MEQLTRDILDDFESITKFDIKSYLQSYATFIDIHYPKIINYYTQLSNVVPQQSFLILKELRTQASTLISIIQSNDSTISEYKFWILVEFIEEIDTNLTTAANCSRWLRSSIVNYQYNQRPQIDIVAKQNQSIEDIERDVLSSSNPQEDWVQTALVNQLREEDYTKEGGFFIKATLKDNRSFSMQNVIDNIDSSEKTYGKDIFRKITFVNDDIKVLSYKETIIQAMDILSNLKQGDNPSFPEDGVDHSLIIGNNLAGIVYPIVFRQLSSTFAKDDTFKSFAITNVEKNSDAVTIYYQVETRTGDFFNTKINL